MHRPPPSRLAPVKLRAWLLALACVLLGCLIGLSTAGAKTSASSTAAKKAALSFISAQPDNVDIGVVAFQQGGLEAALPTADHATASAAVRRLKAAGGTSLGDAILASLSAITHKTVAIGRDGRAPNIGFWPSATIVLLSDGQNEGGAAGSSTGEAVGHRAFLSRKLTRTLYQ